MNKSKALYLPARLHTLIRRTTILRPSSYAAVHAAGGGERAVALLTPALHRHTLQKKIDCIIAGQPNSTTVAWNSKAKFQIRVQFKMEVSFPAPLPATKP